MPYVQYCFFFLKFICCIFVFILLTYVILFPRLGIKPAPPAEEVPSLNHWVAREVLCSMLFHDNKGKSIINIATLYLKSFICFLFFYHTAKIESENVSHSVCQTLWDPVDCSPLGNSWRRQQHPTPVLLPGKAHGWRSLVGCSPWGRTESDTTEVTQQQQQATLRPWYYPDKNTGVGSHSLLKGIFQTQGSNLDLLHCRQILHHLNSQGSPQLRFTEC